MTSARAACSLPHATGCGSGFTVQSTRPDTAGGCALPNEGAALPKSDGFMSDGDSDSANAGVGALARRQVSAHQPRNRYRAKRNRWLAHRARHARRAALEGGASWSASLPHRQCWLPELAIALHNLARGPGRPRRRPSLPRPGPVGSPSRAAVRISRAGFEAFTAVIVDEAGDLYIADGGNRGARRVGPGESITTFAAPGWGPSAGTAVRPQLLNSSSCGGWRPSRGQPLPGDDALWRADACLQTIVLWRQTQRGP